MNKHRLWYIAAILLLCVSAFVGCAHHAGCGCPAPGGYGAPGGTYAPPGSGGGAPYQAPRGSGMF